MNSNFLKMSDNNMHVALNTLVQAVKVDANAVQHVTTLSPSSASRCETLLLCERMVGALYCDKRGNQVLRALLSAVVG
jgi:hypothetical protein